MRASHAFLLVLLLPLLTGCPRGYVESVPRRELEGGPEAHYQRIFRKPIPPEVQVVNSRVMTYGWRPGVVTTDDFEFEIIAPDSWIAAQVKRFYARRNDDEFFTKEIAWRKEKAAPWYAPKPLDAYELYRDRSSVGYIHILAEKEAQSDGRRRVFVSKH